MIASLNKELKGRLGLGGIRLAVTTRRDLLGSQRDGGIDAKGAARGSGDRKHDDKQVGSGDGSREREIQRHDAGHRGA